MSGIEHSIIHIVWSYFGLTNILIWLTKIYQELFYCFTIFKTIFLAWLQKSLARFREFFQNNDLKVMLLFSDSSWEVVQCYQLLFVAAKMCPENPHSLKKCHIWPNFARVLVNFNRSNRTILIQNTLHFYPKWLC